MSIPTRTRRGKFWIRLSPTNQVAPKAAGRPKMAVATAVKTTTRRPAGCLRARTTAVLTRPPVTGGAMSAPLAQPGPQNHSGVLQSEEDVVALLRLARRPRVPHGGALPEPPSAC